jgi:hypothetical protein
MADDMMSELLGALGGAGAGGVGAVVAVKMTLASFKEQMTELARAMREHVEKSDKRHEDSIGERATMKSSIDAAHRRADELARRVDELERKGRRR